MVYLEYKRVKTNDMTSQPQRVLKLSISRYMNYCEL